MSNRSPTPAHSSFRPDRESPVEDGVRVGTQSGAQALAQRGDADAHHPQVDGVVGGDRREARLQRTRRRQAGCGVDQRHGHASRHLGAAEPRLERIEQRGAAVLGLVVGIGIAHDVGGAVASERTNGVDVALGDRHATPQAQRFDGECFAAGVDQHDRGVPLADRQFGVLGDAVTRQPGGHHHVRGAVGRVDDRGLTGFERGDHGGACRRHPHDWTAAFRHGDRARGRVRQRRCNGTVTGDADGSVDPPASAGAASYGSLTTGSPAHHCAVQCGSTRRRRTRRCARSAGPPSTNPAPHPRQQRCAARPTGRGRRRR